MSGILMGIHFGDSFMYALYSWMVNGKRKILEHMFSFSTFMARIIWDRSLSFLTMLSWVLGDYYFYYYSIRIIGKILLFVSKCFLSIFLYFSTLFFYTGENFSLEEDLILTPFFIQQSVFYTLLSYKLLIFL